MSYYLSTIFRKLFLSFSFKLPVTNFVLFNFSKIVIKVCKPFDKRLISGRISLYIRSPPNLKTTISKFFCFPLVDFYIMSFRFLRWTLSHSTLLKILQKTLGKSIYVFIINSRENHSFVCCHSST